MTSNIVVTQTNTQLLVTEDNGSEVVVFPASAPSIALAAEGPQGAIGSAGPPKSLTIAYPVAGDNLTLFYTQTNTTLIQVAAVLRGTSSPSVTYILKYAANRSSSGTAATLSTTVSSTTTASIATLQNMPIPANNFLWLEVSSISGNPTELNITVAV
jgi:hypothetical protein